MIIYVDFEARKRVTKEQYYALARMHKSARRLFQNAQDMRAKEGHKND